MIVKEYYSSANSRSFIIYFKVNVYEYATTKHYVPKSGFIMQY